MPDMFPSLSVFSFYPQLLLLIRAHYITLGMRTLGSTKNTGYVFVRLCRPAYVLYAGCYGFIIIVFDYLIPLIHELILCMSITQ